jgi:hypothetical protein
LEYMAHKHHHPLIQPSICHPMAHPASPPNPLPKDLWVTTGVDVYL